MNCHEVSKLIAKGEIDPQRVGEHLSTCPSCRRAAEFEGWLKEAFPKDLVLDSRVVDRVRDRANALRSSRPLSRGASMMKKTALTTAGALALTLGIFALMSTPAAASSPKAKFAAMKSALIAKKNQMKISISIAAGPDGKPVTKAIIDGHVFDLKDGVPFEYHDGDVGIGVTSSTTVEQKVIVDGKELTGKDAEDWLKAHGLKVGLPEGFESTVDFDFDLDLGAYSKVAFGSNQNTLLLTPKKQAATRYSVILDPQTNLPKTVTRQVSKAGKWVDANFSKFQYTPKIAK